MNTALAASRAPIARTASSFEFDVMRGLALRQKAIPRAWLYDDRGRELFEQILQRDAY